MLGGPKKVSKEPTEMTSKEEDQALSSVAAMLKKNFQSRPEFSSIRDQVKIDVTDQGLHIQIVDKADRVSFASGSAAMTAEASAVLAEIARGICSLPNLIQVGGHTDRRLFAPGSTYTNWELSTDRANAARRALEANCVKPENVKRVVGHADTELLFPDDPFAPANRRISITVLRQQPIPGTHKNTNPAEDGHTKDEPDKKALEDGEKKQVMRLMHRPQRVRKRPLR
ncbi:MAG: OmpA family protein [Pyrinomonadaceae bacterium]